jgi:hypothetical protein
MLESQNLSLCRQLLHPFSNLIGQPFISMAGNMVDVILFDRGPSRLSRPVGLHLQP